MAMEEALDFFDMPSAPAGTTLQFMTVLASVDVNGFLDSTHGFFTWEWSNVGGTGAAKNVRRCTECSIPVPEPAVVVLLGPGAAALLLAARRRRTRRGSRRLAHESEFRST
jgi:hypothetical protein